MSLDPTEQWESSDTRAKEARGLARMLEEKERSMAMCLLYYYLFNVIISSSLVGLRLLFCDISAQECPL